MVRPDRLVIEPDSGDAAAPNRLRGTVVQRLFLGGHFEYAVAVGPTLLRVFSPVQIDEAARVVVSFAAQDGIVLGARGGVRGGRIRGVGLIVPLRGSN